MLRTRFIRLVFGLLGLLFISHIGVIAQFDSFTTNRSLTGFASTFINPDGGPLFAVGRLSGRDTHIEIRSDDYGLIAESLVTQDVISVNLSGTTMRFLLNNKGSNNPRFTMPSSSDMDRLKQFVRSDVSLTLRRMILAMIAERRSIGREYMKNVFALGMVLGEPPESTNSQAKVNCQQKPVFVLAKFSPEFPSAIRPTGGVRDAQCLGCCGPGCLCPPGCNTPACMAHDLCLDQNEWYHPDCMALLALAIYSMSDCILND